MARPGLVDIILQSQSLPDKLRELTDRTNDRLRLVGTVLDANEGAGVRWTETALPTAGVQFAGRLLYHDRGQGVTADNLYVCLWNGAAWAWVLLA